MQGIDKSTNSSGPVLNSLWSK